MAGKRGNPRGKNLFIILDYIPLPLMAEVIVAAVLALFVLSLVANRNAGGHGLGIASRQQFKLQSGQRFSQQGGQPYDEYLQFVLQVPRTVNPSSTLNQSFTIHGLWPVKWGDPYFIDCDTSYTPVRLLNQLSYSLERNLWFSWPNVKPRISRMYFWTQEDHDLKFWTEQYKKHGSCAHRGIRPPGVYFREADVLYRSNPIQNLINFFVNGSILPGQQYRVSTYVNLVKSVTRGKLPRLQCSGSLLKEVVICYNKFATQMRDCSALMPSNCPGLISYPI